MEKYQDYERTYFDLYLKEGSLTVKRKKTLIQDSSWHNVAGVLTFSINSHEEYDFQYITFGRRLVKGYFTPELMRKQLEDGTIFDEGDTTVRAMAYAGKQLDSLRKFLEENGKLKEVKATGIFYDHEALKSGHDGAILMLGKWSDVKDWHGVK